ncbi:MAG: hypothetical protein U1E95_13065 [Rubrivivax sp.]
MPDPSSAAGAARVLLTMRVLVLSDLHLEVAPLALPDPGPFDVAVLAGDIHCRPHAIAGWVRGCPVLRRARRCCWCPATTSTTTASCWRAPPSCGARRQRCTRRRCGC